MWSKGGHIVDAAEDEPDDVSYNIVIYIAYNIHVSCVLYRTILYNTE